MSLSNELLAFCDAAVLGSTIPILLLFVVFGLDDFLIDLCAWILRVRPTEITPKELGRIHRMPEKNLAIMVAAWKEDGILRQMIRGNLSSIDYQNYSFFLGVYPNDQATREEAEELAAQIPNVHVIVNPLEGPTCKGQMLNVVVRGIFQWEAKLGTRFDAMLIHDSEDLIHAQEFKLVNRDLDHNDFVQIPVFSLPVSPFAWVAGIYIDEFAEAHTKSVLVRNRLGVAIPSAGVGTAISRKLVQSFIQSQSGDLLNMGSLTEDYELGLTTRKFNVHSSFSCHYILTGKRKNFIATREYFPKALGASVRQKSRWTLGIAFQGLKNLGWSGSFLHRYFLFRDRKGPFCNALVMVSLIFLAYSGVRNLVTPGFLASQGELPYLEVLGGVNLFFMINRLLSRMWSVRSIYGWKLAILSPVRWPLANLINFLATYKAIHQYYSSKLSGKQPRWIKTDHELPAEFGVIFDLPVDQQA